MEELEQAYKVRELLCKNRAYLKLKKLEKKMEEDKKVSSLLATYQDAQQEYNKAIENKENKSEAQKRLADIKFRVDTHPLIVKYNKQYKKVNALVKEINDIVLKDVNI